MANTGNRNTRDFHAEHLGRLTGGVIRGVITDPGAKAEFGQSIYGLDVEMPAAPGRGARRLNVWILCDPEGNGPGFLDIEEEG